MYSQQQGRRHGNGRGGGWKVGLVVGILATCLLIPAVVGVGCYQFINRTLARFDQRHKVGLVLTAGDTLLSLVESERTTSYSQRGGMVRRGVSATYALQANRVGDGQTVATADLGAGRGMVGHRPHVIGLTPPLLWVMTDQLRAYDARTLKQAADEADLAAKNPGLAGAFVHDSSVEKFYQTDPAGTRLLVTTNDGRCFAVNPATLAATEREPLAAEDRRLLWDALGDGGGTSDRHPSSLTTGTAEDGARFLWLAAKGEINNGIWSYMAFGEAARRSLWQAANRPERHGSERTGKPSPVRGGATFLGGGFLTRGVLTRGVLTRGVLRKEPPRTGKGKSGGSGGNGDAALDFLRRMRDRSQEKREALRLTGPASFLVLHLDKVDATGRFLVSRVRPDGETLWTAQTSILKDRLNDLRLTPTHLLVFGKDKDDSSGEATHLLGVDLKTGKAWAHDYKVGAAGGSGAAGGTPNAVECGT